MKLQRRNSRRTSRICLPTIIIPLTIVLLILLIRLDECSSAQGSVVDQSIPAAMASSSWIEDVQRLPQIVTPRTAATPESEENQQNLINARREESFEKRRPSTTVKPSNSKEAGRSTPNKRRRIHSVSRSVNSFRSPFGNEKNPVVAIHRHQHQPANERRPSSRVDSAEPVEAYEQTQLNHYEGLERAVILVPAAIRHPKVLTAETFVGRKLKFKESEGKSARISKRVDGETGEVDENKTTSEATSTTVEEGEEERGLSTVAELGTVTAAGQHNDEGTAGAEEEATTTITSHAQQNSSLKSQKYLQISPEAADLWMARLRRFNKASLLKDHRRKLGGGGAAKIKAGALSEYMRHIGLLDEHKHADGKLPEISFLIDDGHISHEQHKEEALPSSMASTNAVAIGPRKLLVPNLRTKFPKNRETQKPIQLTKAEESDMDLLTPPGKSGAQQKPIQRHSSAYSQQPHFPAQQQFQNAQNSLASAAASPSLAQQRPLPLPIVPQQSSRGPPPPPFPGPISSSSSSSSSLPLLPAAGLLHSPLPSRLHSPTTRRPISPHLLAGNHSSNILHTLAPPPTPILTPNAKLELCCRRQKLADSCRNFCNFDTFTQEKLLVALLGTQCPAVQLGKAFDCAHSRVDHSECCERAGIHLINGGQCMVFCRTHIPTPPNVLGYVSCLSQFGTIKNCYRDHQLKHRNLFGD